MHRPPSIILFERCYLAALAIGLVGLATQWGEVRDQMTVLSGGAGAVALGVGLVFGIAVPLALWYFAARRASGVAKWIIVVLFVLGALTALYSLLLTHHGGLETVLNVVQLVLNGVAAWLLFKPDAEAWFAEAPPAADPVE